MNVQNISKSKVIWIFICLLGVLTLACGYQLRAYAEEISKDQPAGTPVLAANGALRVPDAIQNAETTFDISNISLYTDGFRVMESDQKDNILWATYSSDKNVLGKQLYASYDNGGTWQLVHEFAKPIQTIKLTPLNVLLVSVASDRYAAQSDGELYRSEDLGKTFTSVLKFQAGAATVWNIDADAAGGVFVSEYGYKSLPNNARRIYRSLDSGKSWKVVYEPAEAQNYHNHKILIDKNNFNVVYQAIGDYPNNKLLCSRDRGETWDVVATGFNPTAAVQYGDHIVWGTDTHPATGIYVMDSSNKITQVLALKNNLGGSCYDMIRVGDRLYAGFMSYAWESQTWDSSLWFSDDGGYTWKQYAVCKKVGNFGSGFYDFTYLNGTLYARASFPIKGPDGTYENYSGTLRIALNKPGETGTGGSSARTGRE